MKTQLQLCDLEEIIFERDYSKYLDNYGPALLDLQIPFLNNSRFQLQKDVYDGVCISYSQFLVKRDMEISGGLDEPTVEMHFNLKGHCRARVDTDPYKRSIDIPENQHFITYLPEPQGTFNFYENETSKFLEINFTPAYLYRFANIDSQTMEDLLNSIEKQELWHTDFQARISTRMHQIARNIVQNPYLGDSRKFYVECQVSELLHLQLTAFGPAPKQYAPPSTPDIEKLHFARDYILNCEEDLPNLHEIGRKAGLNEFKLKSGFRQLFGETVYGMFLTQRMEKAFRLLYNSDLSIAEISYMSGYCHQQHFTTAFKKKYGVTPSKIKRSVKN